MKDIAIGLLGLGTVGSGVMYTLEKNANALLSDLGYRVRIKRALVKQITECASLSIPRDLTLTEDVNDILNDPEIEIVVEVMGGIHPAKEFILQAIEKGKNIVSANKDLIALHGAEIVAKAYEKGVDFMCEASVGGGIPILLPLQKSLKANQIQEIVGIVNGTTNYILSEMTHQQASYEVALRQAQDNGFAESDPTADVGGFDAARKIAILASLGFRANVALDHVEVEGIERIAAQDIQFADEFGYVIKLLATAKQLPDGIAAAVYPAFVPKSHPLAAVRGSYNAIYVVGNAVDDVMFYGKGAGSFPTASAVLGDVLEICRHIQYNMTGKDMLLKVDTKAPLADPLSMVSSYYFRLKVNNAPGVLSEISGAFAKQNVSIQTMWQRSDQEDLTDIVMVVYPAVRRDVLSVAKALESLDCVHCVENLIRVWDEGQNE